MGRDKRGFSAKFLQGELAVAYQTAWTMAHKLRHGLSEDPARPLRSFLEADETFIGGRGGPASRGRSTANPDKSLVVAAVEKVPALQNKNGKHGHDRQREKEAEWRWDLSGTYLSAAYLERIYLARADLSEAHFEGAWLTMRISRKPTSRMRHFEEADLDYTHFERIIVPRVARPSIKAGSCCSA